MTIDNRQSHGGQVGVAPFASTYLLCTANDIFVCVYLSSFSLWMNEGRESKRRVTKKASRCAEAVWRQRKHSFDSLLKWLFMFIVFVVASSSCVYVTESIPTMSEEEKCEKRIMCWLAGWWGEEMKEIYIPHPVFIVIWVRFLCFAGADFFLFALAWLGLVLFVRNWAWTRDNFQWF